VKGARSLKRNAVNNDADTLAESGRRHLFLRQLPEAVARFRQALLIRPQDGSLHAALARALQQQGREFDALDEYRRALALGAAPASLNMLLALLFFDHGERRQALDQFRQIAARDVDPLRGRLMLIKWLIMEGAHDEATSSIREILEEFPRSADALCLLGRLEMDRGDFTAAADSFERALSSDPDTAAAQQGLIAIRRVSTGDGPLITEMERLLQKSSLVDGDRMLLHYGLGKAREDLGNYSAAWSQFREANRIKRRLLVRTRKVLDQPNHAATIDQVISLFTPDFIARHQAIGSGSERPVFIVGMIRSGTTLVEQILSRHPQMAAGGELKFWNRRAYLHSLLQANAFEAAAAAQTAAAYEKLLGSISTESLRVTDKMPTNFLLLGLIHLLFPKARIVHCVRDPRDICVSIFTTAFENPPDFTSDWNSIVFYYRQYARLMQYWKQILPAECLMEVSYQRLVAQPETVTRELIGFCGLPWNELCLSPQSNTRIVATPSNWQARQPVYDRSVGRWRHYAPWLERLGDLAG